MFGIVTAQLSTVSNAEKERYHALYCGLCRALKTRYGQVSRAVLTYDLTFYIMLCDSLHEPDETTGAEHCLTHPMKKMPFAQSRFTDYAADLAVALAYHKCLDDWNDDRSKKARAAQAVLKAPYELARERIGGQCRSIERSMERGALIEADPEATPDAAAREFGDLLGTLFMHGQGIWTEAMHDLGYELGRFIYLMDAAVDFAADKEHGSYNPLAKLDMTPRDMETLLSVLIGRACAVFEKLPLERDLHLMRSILYAGVWQKFNETYRADDGARDASAERTETASPAHADDASANAPASDDDAETSGEREHHD